MKTYLKHKIHNVVDIKALNAVEYLDFCGKYRNYCEKHNFWELCYVINGEVTLILENNETQLKSKDIYFIPPDKTHRYLSDSSNKNEIFVICFETFSYSMKSLGGSAFCTDDTIKDCLQKIIAEYENTFFMNEDDHLDVLENPNFGGQQAIILQLEYLIICLLRKLSIEKNPDVVFFYEEDFYANLCGIITDYLRENVYTKLSLENICNKVNYSKSFLCKIFKEQMGETLFSYFNRLKTEEAKKLLEETDLSVTAISNELGFTNTKYFGALFKKLEGISPTEYKNLIIQKIK